MKFCNLGIKRNVCMRKVCIRTFDSIGYGLLIGQLKAIPWNLGQFQSQPKICEQFDIFCRLTKSRDVFPPHLLPRKKDLRKSLPASSQSPYYCWFSRDVKAAMLDEKNKALLSNSQIHVNSSRKNSTVLSSNMAAFSRGFKLFTNQEQLK